MIGHPWVNLTIHLLYQPSEKSESTRTEECLRWPFMLSKPIVALSRLFNDSSARLKSPGSYDFASISSFSVTMIPSLFVLLLVSRTAYGCGAGGTFSKHNTYRGFHHFEVIYFSLSMAKSRCIIARFLGIGGNEYEIIQDPVFNMDISPPVGWTFFPPPVCIIYFSGFRF